MKALLPCWGHRCGHNAECVWLSAWQVSLAYAVDREKATARQARAWKVGGPCVNQQHTSTACAAVLCCIHLRANTMQRYRVCSVMPIDKLMQPHEATV